MAWNIFKIFFHVHTFLFMFTYSFTNVFVIDLFIDI